MPALGSSELHHLEFKQFLKRTEADLLDPAEQLATTVDDPLDHRQQQLLRCAQWTGTDLPRLSSLCSLLHWRLLSHLGERCSLARPILRPAWESPLLTQIPISTSDGPSPLKER